MDITQLLKESQQDKQTRIRNLRRAFSNLRDIGLLHFSDHFNDIHTLQSFEYTLKPALLKCLEGKTSCCSIQSINSDHQFSIDEKDGLNFSDIAEKVLSQDAFQRISLDWIEFALQELITHGSIVQKGHLFYFPSPT